MSWDENDLGGFLIGIILLRPLPLGLGAASDPIPSGKPLTEQRGDLGGGKSFGKRQKYKEGKRTKLGNYAPDRGHPRTLPKPGGWTLPFPTAQPLDATPPSGMAAVGTLRMDASLFCFEKSASSRFIVCLGHLERPGVHSSLSPGG